MSKDYREYQEYIFRQFYEYGASAHNVCEPVDREYDFELFKQTKLCETEPLIGNIKICKYQNGIFVVSNIANYITDSTESLLGEGNIAIRPPEQAIFMTAAMDLGLKRSKLSTDNEIENEITYIEAGESHSWETLQKHLEPYTIFAPDSYDSPLVNLSALEFGGLVFTYLDDVLALNIQSLLNSYRNLFINVDKIPKDNLFLSMSSTHWKHCFLELYRSIECIYSIPRAMELKEMAGFEGAALQLSTICERSLGWRRKEEDSLKKLIGKYLEINSLPSNLITLLQSNYEMINPIKEDKVANKLYSIRNDLVHHTYGNRGEIDENEWIVWLDFLLKLSESLYQIYEKEI